MQERENRVPFNRRLPAGMIKRLEDMIPFLRPEIQNVTHAVEIALEEFMEKRKKQIPKD